MLCSSTTLPFIGPSVRWSVGRSSRRGYYSSNAVFSSKIKVSVSRSVGRSVGGGPVGRSDGRSVGPSVGRSVVSSGLLFKHCSFSRHAFFRQKSNRHGDSPIRAMHVVWECVFPPVSLSRPCPVATTLTINRMPGAQRHAEPNPAGELPDAGLSCVVVMCFLKRQCLTPKHPAFYRSRN